MNPTTATLTSFDAFQKARTAPPAPPRTIQLSREVGAKARAFLGLSADAPVEEIAQKLDDLGKAAKDQEDGRTLVPVQRRGPLTMPPATQPAKRAKAMRAATRGAQRRATRGPLW